MKYVFMLITAMTINFCLAQKTIPKVLEQLNNKTVPYLSIAELKTKVNVVLLDSREQQEYDVSHIKGAIHIGFNQFDPNKVIREIPNKNTAIVVYCSIGVRSEKIGEKLLKMGYKNVFNLFGGIFEWKNTNGKVINSKGMETNNIHTFNKNWSQYLKKGTKIYED